MNGRRGPSPAASPFRPRHAVDGHPARPALPKPDRRLAPRQAGDPHLQGRRPVARGGATRERLLDIAEAGVLAKGFAGTSIDEIIAEAEITKSGFFYHFRDKNELARANSYYGAWALSTDAPELPVAAATARLSAGKAYWLAAKETIQTFGGIGFTWDVDAQLYYRRHKALKLNLGAERFWENRLIDGLKAGLVEL